jgi:hypothetical protein
MSGLRGWLKDQQRGVFQPVAVAIFLMSVSGVGLMARQQSTPDYRARDVADDNAERAQRSYVANFHRTGNETAAALREAISGGSFR